MTAEKDHTEKKLAELARLSDAEAAHRWRLQQAQKLIDEFLRSIKRGPLRRIK